MFDKPTKRDPDHPWRGAALVLGSLAWRRFGVALSPGWLAWCRARWLDANLLACWLGDGLASNPLAWRRSVAGLAGVVSLSHRFRAGHPYSWGG